MNFAYPLAALASVFYGGADYFGGMAARRSPAPVVTFASTVVGLPVMLLWLLVFAGVPTSADVAWSVAAGACGSIAAALIYRALAIGPVSIASPVLSLVAMSLPVVVGLALGERPSPVALGGLALAVVAIPLLSLAGDASAAAAAPGEAPAPVLRLVNRVLPVSFAAGIMAGLFLVFIGRVSHGAGLTPLVISRLVAIALFSAWLFARRLPRWPAPGARGSAIASGLLDSFANVAYLFAVQRGSLALVAALISLSPATAVVMARALLGERWSVPQRWGLAAALAAGACISVG